MNSFHLHIKKQNRCLLGGSWATDLNDDHDDDDDDDDDDDGDDDMSEHGSYPPVPSRNARNEVDAKDGYASTKCVYIFGM